MTRERKLAIKMWQEIVKNLKKKKIAAQFKIYKSFNVMSYKETFCKRHNLKWRNNCYLCQYCKTCLDCPLKNCLSEYYAVINEYDIKAAEKILNTLCGGANGNK